MGELEAALDENRRAGRYLDRIWGKLRRDMITVAEDVTAPGSSDEGRTAKCGDNSSELSALDESEAAEKWWSRVCQQLGRLTTVVTTITRPVVPAGLWPPGSAYGAGAYRSSCRSAAPPTAPDAPPGSCRWGSDGTGPGRSARPEPSFRPGRRESRLLIIEAVQCRTVDSRFLRQGISEELVRQDGNVGFLDSGGRENVNDLIRGTDGFGDKLPDCLIEVFLGSMLPRGLDQGGAYSLQLLRLGQQTHC